MDEVKKRYYEHFEANTSACRALLDKIEKVEGNWTHFKDQSEVPYYNGFKDGSNGLPIDTHSNGFWDGYPDDLGQEYYEMGWYDATENFIPD